MRESPYVLLRAFHRTAYKWNEQKSRKKWFCSIGGPRRHYQTVPLYMKIVFLFVKPSLRVKLAVFCDYFSQCLITFPSDLKKCDYRNYELKGRAPAWEWEWLFFCSKLKFWDIYIFVSKEFLRGLIFIYQIYTLLTVSHKGLGKAIGSWQGSNSIASLKRALLPTVYYNKKLTLPQTQIFLLR